MKDSRIAVMAGTATDTVFGVRLVEKITANVISLPISNTPEEQTLFQTMDRAKRFALIKALLSQHRDLDFLLVYCNSLSSTTDFPKLADECRINILTPLNFYSEIAQKYSSFTVLAANAQGCAGIERTVLTANPRARVYSLANLDWVNAVENKVEAQIIFNESGLREAVDFAQKTGSQCIVLGCTHFPYFQDYLQTRTAIPVISADEYLLSYLERNL